MTTNRYGHGDYSGIDEEPDEETLDALRRDADAERYDELTTGTAHWDYASYVDDVERAELEALAVKYGWAVPTFTPAPPHPDLWDGCRWWTVTGGAR